TDLNLILAVDVPFVSPAFLQYLAARARDSAALATVVRAGGGWQPLCAVYRREFADAAEAALRAGSFKIDALFNTVPTHQITETKLEQAGFAVTMFRNLNTREELEAAALEVGVAEELTEQRSELKGDFGGSKSPYVEFID